jgi:hypothetical protein
MGQTLRYTATNAKMAMIQKLKYTLQYNHNLIIVKTAAAKNGVAAKLGRR